MKNNRLHRKLYEKQEELRLAELHERKLNESLTNPLLKRYEEVPNYYKTWHKESELIAVIPALDLEDPNAHSYFSVGSLKNGDEAERIRVSPVFMYINNNFYSLIDNDYNPNMKCFIFDSEESKLYSYEKKRHSQEYHYVKKDTFEKMKQHIISHPVVLYFKGCDDGHVGKRFKTSEEAVEYLQLLDVFEDIFDEDLQYHN